MWNFEFSDFFSWGWGRGKSPPDDISGRGLGKYHPPAVFLTPTILFRFYIIYNYIILLYFIKIIINILKMKS